jgi:glycolate oxidase
MTGICIASHSGGTIALYSISIPVLGQVNMPDYNYNKVDRKVVERLEEIVGPKSVSTAIADRYVYGFDASIYRKTAEAVVCPRSTKEVREIVLLANERRIPVVPRGAGTGLCGQVVPIEGGIVIDFQAMNRIKEIRVENLYVIVEPGVIYDDLNRALKPYKFFFPPGPASGEVCQIGGMVGNNASGMRAIKYGATRDFVMGLEVVLPTGDVMRCGTKTLKNASGYQLEKLFVGSEGTLGIVTEIILRVLPLPKNRVGCMACFDSIEKAGQSISNIIAAPIIPDSMEFMDSTCIKAVNKSLGNPFPDCESIVLLELGGYIDEIRQDLKRAEDVFRKSGATTVEATEDTKKMDKWSSSRKAVLPSLSRLGEKFVSVSLADDMAVPISEIPKAVVAFQKIAERNGIIVGTYGHASDGNLHTKVLVDPWSKSSWAAAEKAVGEIFDTTIALGGTVTGEHGTGISKAPYMQKERASALKTMIAIKRALDPNNIMNPHKMFDWEKSIIYSLRYPVRS